MSSRLSLVKCEEKFWDFIRDLRNNEEVRKSFFNDNIVTKSEHYQFMQTNGKDYWICLKNNKPIGYVSIREKEVSIATEPREHGKGVASFMLEEMIKKVPNLIARVKVDNITSVNLFEKYGFVKCHYVLKRDK